MELYGNDISKEMLEQAEVNCVNNDNISFKNCSNYKLDFNDNEFDIVIAKNVTRFSAKEIYRVLKKNGVFIYREYGKYKGLVEVAKLFKNRLIRSRYKSYYDNKMRSANFHIVFSNYVKEKKIYNDIDEIIKIIEAFPMIVNFNKKDKKMLSENYKNQRNIEILSDGILAVYKKEG